MEKTRQWALDLAREFQEKIAPIYGDRLKGVYLYGSYARGDANEDSDVDVAVVLGGPVKFVREISRISEIRCDLSLRETCIVEPFFLSEDEFQTAPYPVHQNISSEGLMI